MGKTYSQSLVNGSNQISVLKFGAVILVYLHYVWIYHAYSNPRFLSSETFRSLDVMGITSLHLRLVLGRDSNKELSSIQAKGTSKGCEQSIVD